MANSKSSAYAVTTEQTYCKGQYIFYQGDEAKILDVKPVFTIKLEGKNKIICGNAILQDVCLKDKRDFPVPSF